MVRTMVFTAAFAMAAVAMAYAQFPSQPPPVKSPSPLGRGNDQEQAACHPDVVKYCQAQLEINPDAARLAWRRHTSPGITRDEGTPAHFADDKPST